MQPYGIPTNQFDVYQKSVHGEALLENQDMRAPTCASCHGSHDAKPPTAREVVEVCGKCHTATQALYEQSRHSQLDAGPKCWTCHGTHDVVAARRERASSTRRHPTYDCTTCHDPADRTLRPGRGPLHERRRPPLRHLPPPGLGHLRPGPGDPRRRSTRPNTAYTTAEAQDQGGGRGRA